jgi:hypothetical protein
MSICISTSYRAGGGGLGSVRRTPREGSETLARRVSRMNVEAEWIVAEVPELRIIDDELRQAVR